MSIAQKLQGFATAVASYKTWLGLAKSTDMGSLDMSGAVGGYAGISMVASKGILRDTGAVHSFWRYTTNKGTGTELWRCDNNGNFDAKGDVGNLSDERLKTNWNIPDAKDIVYQLAGIEKYGTYDRTDVDRRQLGASANEFKKTFMGQAVLGTGEGENYFSMSYGQVATVGAIALAKHVKTLEERIEELERLLAVTKS